MATAAGFRGHRTSRPLDKSTTLNFGANSFFRARREAARAWDAVLMMLGVAG